MTTTNELRSMATLLQEAIDMVRRMSPDDPIKSAFVAWTEDARAALTAAGVTP